MSMTIEPTPNRMTLEDEQRVALLALEIAKSLGIKDAEERTVAALLAVVADRLALEGDLVSLFTRKLAELEALVRARPARPTVPVGSMQIEARAPWSADHIAHALLLLKQVVPSTTLHTERIFRTFFGLSNQDAAELVSGALAAAR